jgi:hypothetical protein
MKTSFEIDTLLARISVLRTRSERLWEAAIETDLRAHSSSVDSDDAWDMAVGALLSGQPDIALSCLGGARRFAAQWGDDQTERAAMRLVEEFFSPR